MAGGGGEADQGLGNTPHPLSQVASTWNFGCSLVFLYQVYHVVVVVAKIISIIYG